MGSVSSTVLRPHPCLCRLATAASTSDSAVSTRRAVAGSTYLRRHVLPRHHGRASPLPRPEPPLRTPPPHLGPPRSPRIAPRPLLLIEPCRPQALFTCS
ncbi:hypothetical protein ZWY2020_005232 [Hordeum vulgare]|nr:hypothetical protein ZWY2020_005232 [Hordeum vulgare]